MLSRTEQDMGDDIIGDVPKEDLVKLGFSTGNAMRFLKAFTSAAAAPAAPFLARVTDQFLLSV
jgi:hypothetical protein